MSASAEMPYFINPSENLSPSEKRQAYEQAVQGIDANLHGETNMIMKMATINCLLKTYLRRSVINKALNHIKAQRIDFEEDQSNLDSMEKASAQENLEFNELQDAINHAIDSLPERCRIVFSMRRFDELSLKEIAAKLDISPKTVENQLTKAMKILRAAVEDFKAKTK